MPVTTSPAAQAADLQGALPLTRTLPSSISFAASERVFTSLAHQSHLSSRWPCMPDQLPSGAVPRDAAELGKHGEGRWSGAAAASSLAWARARDDGPLASVLARVCLAAISRGAAWSCACRDARSPRRRRGQRCGIAWRSAVVSDGSAAPAPDGAAASRARGAASAARAGSRAPCKIEAKSSPEQPTTDISSGATRKPPSPVAPAGVPRLLALGAT